MNPLTIVIFGASGDLTSRKLVPALYSLAFKAGCHPARAVVGVSRSPWSDDRFREHLLPGTKAAAGDGWDDGRWREFASRLHYVSGDATQAGGLAAPE